MANYFVIDDKRGEIIDYYGPYKTEEQARRQADYIWERLTEKEQGERYLAYGTADPERIDEEDFLDSFSEIKKYAIDSDLVETEDGDLVSFSAAVAGMDDELREAVNGDLAPCSKQDFYNEYCKRHEQKYGAAFEI